MSNPQTSDKTRKGTRTDSEYQNSHPYSWLKKIPESLVELNHLPLLGQHEEFPFKQLSQKLRETFGLSSLDFEPETCVLRTKESLKEGMGGELVCLHFALSPLEGPLYYLMSKQDFLTFASKIFLKNGEPSLALEGYLDACTAFFAAEVIHALESLSFGENFHPQLLETGNFPSENMVTIDITIHLPSYKGVGRFLFSKNLQNSLRTSSTQKEQKTLFTSSLAEQTKVVLHLEAGSVELSQKEWKSVKPGDFLILDSSGFKQNRSETEIMLSLKGHPLCKAKIEDGKVTILEHPYEVI